MDTSKLAPLGLSKLELESIVEGSESSVGLGFLHDYPLVGGGEVTSPYCGNFSDWKICLDVETHKSVGVSGVFTRKIHYSCGKLTCPICTRMGWAMKEARKVEARLKVASERLHLPVEHISINFDPKWFGIGDEKVLRKMALKACEDLGIDDGFLVFHGSRHRRFERVNGEATGKLNGFRQFGTDWSPHYHELGFVKGGYTCRECRRKCFEGCGGFNDRRWQYAKKTGIYVKVIVHSEHKYEERRSIKLTAWYELHHSSIRRDAKRAHVGTWHGATCSYRKMGKVKVVKEAGFCPLCEIAGKKKALEYGIYIGKKNFVLNRYDPDYEKDSMQDLYEDGLQVWYIKPKRGYGSPVKNGFTVKFEGGKHG